MNKSTLMGILTGVIAVIAFALTLGMGLSYGKNLFEAFGHALFGIAFLFSFGLGVNKIVSIILSGLIFVGVFFAGFFLGKKLFKS